MVYFYKSLNKFKRSVSKVAELEFYYLTTGCGHHHYKNQIKKYNHTKDQFIKAINDVISNEKNNKVIKQVASSYYKIVERNKGHTNTEYDLIHKLTNNDLHIDEYLDLLAGLINSKSTTSENYIFFEINENIPTEVRNKDLYKQVIDKIELSLNSDMFKGLETRTGYTFEDLSKYADNSTFISEVSTIGSSSFCSFIKKGNNKISISKRWLNDEFRGKAASSLAHEIGHAYYQTHHVCNKKEFSDLGKYPSLYKHETAAILFELVLGGYNSEQRNTGLRLTSDKQNYLKHILLRCKMELEMFELGREGKLTGEYIKKLWLESIYKYLDLRVEPETIKQDLHWFRGIFGYFYSYGLALSEAIPIYKKIIPVIGVGIEEDILIINNEINIHSL